VKHASPVNLCLSSVTAFLLALPVCAASAEQPNFVVIMADDVSPEMYGCYGSKEAKTPNLDRLAQQGVMFNTAWACALCLPARAEIMTGCYATRTGVWSNGFAIPREDGSPELFKYFPSFARLLKEAGYATAIAGKWHLSSAEPPDSPAVGFDQYSLWVGEKELSALPDQKRADVAMENDETPSRYWQPSIVQNGKIYPSKPDEFGPTINADFLCGFMERSVQSGKPFLAYFPTAAPHGARNGMPTTPLYGKPGDNGSDDRQENARRFRALNDYLDVLVGRLEQKTRELGVYDNTVFIFTADNGTAVVAKSRGTERGCRVPMIAWGGPVKQRGPTDEITDFSDILSTLVDFAGAKLPLGANVDGKSLKPFLTGATDMHREYILSCIGTTRLARTRTYLLEAVDAILGAPRGRFYYCGDSRDGRGYQRVDNDPKHATARKQFGAILAEHPGLTADHPYFHTRKGAKWLAAYTDPQAVEKHLHNHKDYQFYDETLPPQEQSPTK